MEEATQMVDVPVEEEGESSPIEALPVGYLKVFAQKAIEEKNYPVAEGETTVGRGADCDVCIAAKSLSRTHVMLLVDGGMHFIQDLGSRNKTYRGSLQLRPHAYYELTHGCELVLADVRCQYLIGELALASTDPEQTQAYDLGDKGGGGGGGGRDETECPATSSVEDSEGVALRRGRRRGGRLESDSSASGEGENEAGKSRGAGKGEALQDSDGSTTAGEEEEDAFGNDIEPTQAYFFPAEGEGESDSNMECEPTVAYNMEALSHSDDSPASPTLLRGKTHEVTLLNPADEENEEDEDKEKEEQDVDGRMTAANAEEKRGSTSTKKRVCFEQTVVYGTANDDEATQPYTSEDTAHMDEGNTTEEREEEKEQEATLDRDNGEGEPTAEGEGDTIEVEPTVAYHLEGNVEDSVVAQMSTAGGPTPTVPYITEDSGEDMTVEEPRSVPRVQSPKTPGTCGMTAEMPTADIGCGETSEVPTGARQTRVAAPVEPTVPYLLESSEEEDQVEKGPTREKEATLVVSQRVGKSHPEVKSDKSEDASDERRPSVSEGDHLKGEGEGESSGSDLNDTIPTLMDAGKHSKQKTLFARQQGRGRGVRGRGRGSSASSGRKDSKVGGEKQRGKGRRGGEVKPKAMMTEPTSSAAVGVTVGDGEDHKGRQRAGRRRRNTGSQIPSREVCDSAATVGSEHSTAARDKVTTDSTAKPFTCKVKPPADSSIVDPLSEESPDITVHMTHGHSSVASSRSTPAKVDPVASKNDSHSSVASSTSTPAKVDPVASKNDSHSSVASSTSTPVKVDPVASKNDSHSSVASSTSTPASVVPVASNVYSSGGSSGSRGGRGRGKKPSTPRKGKATKPALKSEASATLRHTTPSPSRSSPSEKPRVMFTGVIDKAGERTVRELGGELVDSVYNCTHLVTDKVVGFLQVLTVGMFPEAKLRELLARKPVVVSRPGVLVRRTVKFLCCLSRGCLIVNDSWLDRCGAQRKFLPAEPFLVKDRSAERQHKFSLSRSHMSAKVTKVLSGYKIFLTSSIKPERDQMADIIKCSGGEVMSTMPLTRGRAEVVIVTCEEDLSMCKAAMEAGVPVHSTEFILGGVLRQELDPHSHLMALPATAGEDVSNGRKRRKKGPASSPPPAKKRRKGV